jgi:hypothetical protein
MISRIDRPDWYRIMAKKHTPWDPNGEGIDWVFNMGRAAAEDYYRRCHSKDTLTVCDNVIKRIPSSNQEVTGHCRKKDDPQRYDVCRGDIEMTSKDVYTDPEDLRGKYKVHTMNVVTGRTSSSINTFHDSLDSALGKAKSIVKRDLDIQVVILKCTHVVQTSGPPVEVIDLDE